MEKKRYFIICMRCMIIVFLLSLCLFFHLFHKPIANPIEEEVMWDSMGEDGTMVYKRIMFSYVTSFADDPDIVGVEVETNTEEIFNYSYENGRIDEKHSVYPETYHNAELYLDYSRSIPITKPIEITKLIVRFSGGYAMEVPIEKCILTPYHKDESQEGVQ